MADVLDYGRPEKQSSISRSLIVGGVVLLVGLCFGVSTMDAGENASITKRLSIAYVTGVAVILVRRRRSLTKGDHWFIRLGLIPILIVGTAVGLTLWEHWRVF